MFHFLTRVTVTWMCTYVKIFQAVHLRLMHFTDFNIDMLHLKKEVQNRRRYLPISVILIGDQFACDFWHPKVNKKLYDASLLLPISLFIKYITGA